MFASHNNLDNLCLIVDFNGLQIDGPAVDLLKEFGLSAEHIAEVIREKLAK